MKKNKRGLSLLDLISYYESGPVLKQRTPDIIRTPSHPHELNYNYAEDEEVESDKEKRPHLVFDDYHEVPDDLESLDPYEAYGLGHEAGQEPHPVGKKLTKKNKLEEIHKQALGLTDVPGGSPPGAQGYRPRSSYEQQDFQASFTTGFGGPSVIDIDEDKPPSNIDRRHRAKPINIPFKTESEDYFSFLETGKLKRKRIPKVGNIMNTEQREIIKLATALKKSGYKEQANTALGLIKMAGQTPEEAAAIGIVARTNAQLLDVNFDSVHLYIAQTVPENLDPDTLWKYHLGSLSSSDTDFQNMAGIWNGGQPLKDKLDLMTYETLAKAHIGNIIEAEFDRQVATGELECSICNFDDGSADRFGQMTNRIASWAVLVIARKARQKQGSETFRLVKTAGQTPEEAIAIASMVSSISGKSGEDVDFTAVSTYIAQTEPGNLNTDTMHEKLMAVFSADGTDFFGNMGTWKGHSKMAALFTLTWESYTTWKEDNFRRLIQSEMNRQIAAGEYDGGFAPTFDSSAAHAFGQVYIKAAKWAVLVIARIAREGEKPKPAKPEEAKETDISTGQWYLKNDSGKGDEPLVLFWENDRKFFSFTYTSTGAFSLGTEVYELPGPTKGKAINGISPILPLVVGNGNGRMSRLGPMKGEKVTALTYDMLNSYGGGNRSHWMPMKASGITVGWKHKEKGSTGDTKEHSKDRSRQSMEDLTGNTVTDTESGNKFRAWVNKTHGKWATDNQLDAENNTSNGWNNKWIRSAWSAWGAEYKQAQGGDVDVEVSAGGDKPGETTGASGATDNYDHLIKYLMIPAGAETSARDALGWREGAKPAFEEDKSRKYIDISEVRTLVQPAYDKDNEGNALAFAMAEISLTSKTLEEAAAALEGETTGGQEGELGGGKTGDYFWSKNDNVYMRKSDGALFYGATTDDGMSLKDLGGRVLDTAEDGENFLNPGEQRRMINEVKRETDDKDLIDLYRQAIVGSRMANNKSFMGIGKEKRRAKGYQRMQGASTALKAYQAQG